MPGACTDCDTEFTLEGPHRKHGVRCARCADKRRTNARARYAAKAALGIPDKAPNPIPTMPRKILLAEWRFGRDILDWSPQHICAWIGMEWDTFARAMQRAHHAGEVPDWPATRAWWNRYADAA